MYTELTPQNASEIVRNATERLQSINSAIKIKEDTIKNLENKIKASNEELVKINSEIKVKENNIVNIKNNIEKISEENDKLAKENIELSKFIVQKSEEFYTFVIEAKDKELESIENRLKNNERNISDTINHIQEKKRVLNTLTEDIKKLDIEIEEKKKVAFNIMKKNEEIQEKEQFIKKKYEDAGINYNN